MMISKVASAKGRHSASAARKSINAERFCAIALRRASEVESGEISIPVTRHPNRWARKHEVVPRPDEISRTCDSDLILATSATLAVSSNPPG